MNLDVDALWLALVAAAVIGAAKLLATRLSEIDHKLQSHGLKLVRIETKLGIIDQNGDA